MANVTSVKTTAYQFGQKTVMAIPAEIVKALQINDGQQLTIALTGDGKVLLSSAKD